MTKSAPRKRKMLRARFPEGDERNFAANPYREQQLLDPAGVVRLHPMQVIGRIDDLDAKAWKETLGS